MLGGLQGPKWEKGSFQKREIKLMLYGDKGEIRIGGLNGGLESRAKKKY